MYISTKAFHPFEDAVVPDIVPLHFRMFLAIVAGAAYWAHNELQLSGLIWSSAGFEGWYGLPPVNTLIIGLAIGLPFTNRIFDSRAGKILWAIGLSLIVTAIWPENFTLGLLLWMTLLYMIGPQAYYSAKVAFYISHGYSLSSSSIRVCLDSGRVPEPARSDIEAIVEATGKISLREVHQLTWFDRPSDYVYNRKF